MKAVYRKHLDQSIMDWPVHMQRALELACNVATANPNPRVGCVLTVDKKVVAEGWHVAPGHPHAEVMALANAQTEVRHGTAFVSLEPCAHYGRTGPCSEALIDAGISTVVIAMIDPNPQVAGRGVRRLEQAGIEVFQLKEMEAAATAINRGYLKRHQSGMPYVILKLAMSMDGRTALASGESQWITGSAARADGQRLRAGSSAIVTGIGTVLADDPRLTVRIADTDRGAARLPGHGVGSPAPPLRVILDSGLRTPADARILQGSGKAVIYSISSNSGTEIPGADRDSHAGRVELRSISRDPDPRHPGVHLPSVLRSLAADFACNEVLVEAGPTLSGSFVAADLVDELVLYLAPKILGSRGKPLVELSDIHALNAAPQFQIVSHGQIGDDMKLVLRRRRE